MSTPKPGQIRCPTCSQSTPPAAFCTQCGSPIPASARVRPRGMDRDELEERVRQRRPGEAAFRRGSELEATGAYEQYTPEPEDALAVRDPDAGGDEPPHIDRTPPAFDEPPRAAAPTPPPSSAGPPVQLPPEPEPEPEPEPAPEAWQASGDWDDGEPPYPYPYPAPEDDRRDSSALPLIGFAALAIMALAVGVILAGVFAGPSGVGDATPTPSAVSSSDPTLEPTETPAASIAPSVDATPEPTDGPVTFADGAQLTIQPCGTYEFKPDLSGCLVDGSTRDAGTVWVLAVFRKAHGTDSLSVLLRSATDTLDRGDVVLGDVVDCPTSCSGLIWAAIYRDLQPGEYELVLRRNGDFADTATFVVE
jgi:hypothetical protein